MAKGTPVESLGYWRRGVAMPPEPVNGQYGAPKALTSTHRPLHCAATPDEGEISELERLQVMHFLEVLSEVAMAVARRKALSGDLDEGTPI